MTMKVNDKQEEVLNTEEMDSVEGGPSLASESSAGMAEQKGTLGDVVAEMKGARHQGGAVATTEQPAQETSEPRPQVDDHDVNSQRRRGKLSY